MSPDKLVRMANQIATFFQSQDAASAAAHTADHLLKFWDPRMRRAIAAYLQAGGSGLDPVSAAAVRLLPDHRASDSVATN